MASSLDDTFIKINFLIDCKTTWTNVNLAHSFWWDSHPHKYFFFKFYHVYILDSVRYLSAIIWIVRVIACERWITLSEITLIIDYKIRVSINDTNLYTLAVLPVSVLVARPIKVFYRVFLFFYNITLVFLRFSIFPILSCDGSWILLLLFSMTYP